MEDIEFGDDGFQFRIVQFQSNFLAIMNRNDELESFSEEKVRVRRTYFKGHRHCSRSMNNLLYRTVIAFSQLFE
jgi:hypothetical protein